MKSQLVASQERLLQYAASVWDAHNTLSGEVLDAGCGLGGGSLFWAQEFEAQVTAVTVASSHIPLIAQFAKQAGVSSRVSPLAHNVLEIPGQNRFDAVVAFESSCHMPRQALFQRLSTLLRPGGHIFIADFFFEQPKYEEVWRQHWYAPVGTLGEYRAAASEAGFQEEIVEDISLRTEHFWTITTALIKAEASQMEESIAETDKVEKSLRAHHLVREGLLKGGLRYALMSFVNNK
jgi:tocopherol O-methyltransferase